MSNTRHVVLFHIVTPEKQPKELYRIAEGLISPLGLLLYGPYMDLVRLHCWSSGSLVSSLVPVSILNTEGDVVETWQGPTQGFLPV